MNGFNVTELYTLKLLKITNFYLHVPQSKSSLQGKEKLEDMYLSDKGFLVFCFSLKKKTKLRELFNHNYRQLLSN